MHRQSVDAFFAEALSRDMLVIAGKVMMDRNAPDGLRDTAQSGYDDTKALIAEWHGKGRLRYAVTPRFAITSTPEQMELAGALMREHPDLHMQTHLSENKAEIAFTQELYPASTDYTDVYARYGLLGPKALFGHCIHLSDREADALSESGSVAVFCPTSNLFLGSGLFDWRGYSKRSTVQIAAATDVRGGTSPMLRTWTGLPRCGAAGKMNPFASDDAGQRQGAVMKSIGTSTLARYPTCRWTQGAAMALRMETVKSLAEELFLCKRRR